MFDNIGEKIKGVAVAETVIGFAASLGGCIYLMSLGGLYILVGFCVLILGCLLSWIGSFLTYGIGHLISNTDRIIENQEKQLKKDCEYEAAPTSSDDGAAQIGEQAQTKNEIPPTSEESEESEESKECKDFVNSLFANYDISNTSSDSGAEVYCPKKFLTISLISLLATIGFVIATILTSTAFLGVMAFLGATISIAMYITVIKNKSIFIIGDDDFKVTSVFSIEKNYKFSKITKIIRSGERVQIHLSDSEHVDIGANSTVSNVFLTRLSSALIENEAFEISRDIADKELAKACGEEIPETNEETSKKR